MGIGQPVKVIKSLRIVGRSTFQTGKCAVEGDQKLKYEHGSICEADTTTQWSKSQEKRRVIRQFVKAITG
jgi:hypothetical protein